MKRNPLNYLQQALTNKYKTEVVINGDLVIVKNASRPNAPIIPEEVTKIIIDTARLFDLRTGELAYTTHGRDLVIQYNKD